MRLIHLTDPHLSNLDGHQLTSLWGKRWTGYLSWTRNRQHKHLPAVLDSLCASVIAENAAQILLTGDLIQIGLQSEIDQAADWLASLGTTDQVMLVPGNHDVYVKGCEEAIHTAWSGYLFNGVTPGEFPTQRKLGKLTLIGLSTAVVTPMFMARGRLSGFQLERLGVLLEQAKEEQQLVCIVIHHPPLPGMEKKRKALSNADELQAVLGKFQPAMVFYGHQHHSQSQKWGETMLVCTSSASSASSASYRVIDIEDGGTEWSFHMVLKTVSSDAAGQYKYEITDEQRWVLSK